MPDAALCGLIVSAMKLNYLLLCKFYLITSVDASLCDKEVATLFSGPLSRSQVLDHYRSKGEPCWVHSEEGLELLLRMTGPPCAAKGTFNDRELMNIFLEKALDSTNARIMDRLFEVWYQECSIDVGTPADRISAITVQYSNMSESRRLFPYYLRLLNRKVGKKAVMEALAGSPLKIIPANLVPALEHIVEPSIYEHPDVLRTFLASKVSDEGGIIAAQALEDHELLMPIFDEIWLQCWEGNESKCSHLVMLPMTIPVFLRYGYLKEKGRWGADGGVLARQVLKKRLQLLRKKNSLIPEAAIPQLVHVIEPNIFIDDKVTSILMERYLDLENRSTVDAFVEAFERAVSEPNQTKETLNLVMASGKEIVLELLSSPRSQSCLRNSAHIHMILCSDRRRDVECPSFMLSDKITLSAMDAIAEISRRDLSPSFIKLIQSKFDVFLRNEQGRKRTSFVDTTRQQRLEYCYRNHLTSIAEILHLHLPEDEDEISEDEPDLPRRQYDDSDEEESDLRSFAGSLNTIRTDFVRNNKKRAEMEVSRSWSHTFFKRKQK